MCQVVRLYNVVDIVVMSGAWFAVGWCVLVFSIICSKLLIMSEIISE